MKIVPYPHPALRYKSKPISRVDSQLRGIVRQMFDLMYQFKGVGLAANQVDLPIRLFIANLASDPQEGEEHVFVNPVISRPKGNEQREEGCLSFPGLYCPVKRPESVLLNSYDLNGKEFEGEVNGFLGRVIQHELDHLDGVLFIDRLSTTAPWRRPRRSRSSSWITGDGSSGARSRTAPRWRCTCRSGNRGIVERFSPQGDLARCGLS